MITRITMSDVDDFLESFDGDRIPVDFIGEIYILYVDGSDTSITGKRIRQLFPVGQKSAPLGILKRNSEVMSIDITIDKFAVYEYLDKLDKDLCELVRKAVDKKGS